MIRILVKSHSPWSEATLSVKSTFTLGNARLGISPENRLDFRKFASIPF